MSDHLTNIKDCANNNLSKAQRAFLDYCRELGWAERKVKVKDGEPVLATEVKQDVKFKD